MSGDFWTTGRGRRRDGPGAQTPREEDDLSQAGILAREVFTEAQRERFVHTVADGQVRWRAAVGGAPRTPTV